MLSVAYISPTGPQKAQRSRKQRATDLLHQEALLTITVRRMHDREIAEKMFAQEMAELEELEREVEQLERMC